MFKIKNQPRVFYPVRRTIDEVLQNHYKTNHDARKYTSISQASSKLVPQVTEHEENNKQQILLRHVNFFFVALKFNLKYDKTSERRCTDVVLTF